MSEASREHQRRAFEDEGTRAVRCSILTVSDTRTLGTDKSGPLIGQLLADAGHEVVTHQVVPDEPRTIRALLDEWIGDPRMQAVLITGGTGVSRRDTTADVVRECLTHELAGFGELFRMISYEQIGAAAMLSRAIGGVVARTTATGGDTLLFAMPGSTNAVETAMTKLILPELSHLMWERNR